LSGERKCPMCGESGGYEYRYLIEYLQHEDFHGNPISADLTGDCKVLKTKLCVECGYNLTKYIEKMGWGKE